MNTSCPCGATDYHSCCGRYHGGEPAPDAGALMRSRYSAYVLKLEVYLLATWHPDTRPAALELASDTCKWIGLEVRKQLPEAEGRSSVEFVVRYKIGGRAHRLHEIGSFVREQGRWLYVDGVFPEQSNAYPPR